MSRTLTLELITPEKVVLTETADKVVLPAFEGEMGILPEHEPYMVQLQPGEVRVTLGSSTKNLVISGGFAEILNDKISIFAETAEMAHEIDEERAKQALEKAKAETKRVGIDPLALAQAEAAMHRARTRLRIKGLRKRPGSMPAGQ